MIDGHRGCTESWLQPDRWNSQFTNSRKQQFGVNKNTLKTKGDRKKWLKKPDVIPVTHLGERLHVDHSHVTVTDSVRIFGVKRLSKMRKLDFVGQRETTFGVVAKESFEWFLYFVGMVGSD